LQGYFLVNHQDLAHLRIKIRITPFQVIADAMRLDVMLIKNSPNRCLVCFSQAWKSCFFSLITDKLRQLRQSPQFSRQPMIFGLGTPPS
jgi:hypothetical protein